MVNGALQGMNEIYFCFVFRGDGTILGIVKLAVSQKTVCLFINKTRNKMSSVVVEKLHFNKIFRTIICSQEFYCNSFVNLLEICAAMLNSRLQM